MGPEGRAVNRPLRGVRLRAAPAFSKQIQDTVSIQRCSDSSLRTCITLRTFLPALRFSPLSIPSPHSSSLRPGIGDVRIMAPLRFVAGASRHPLFPAPACPVQVMS